MATSSMRMAGLHHNCIVMAHLQLMHRLEDYCGTPIINGTLILWHKLLGYRRPVEWCEQPDRHVVTRVRGRGRTGLSDA